MAPFTAISLFAGVWATRANESPIDPRYAENITVYRLGPRRFGPIPTDQNSGDLGGDLFFYLGQFTLPIECRDPEKAATDANCNNPDRVDPDLAVTMIEMEIDNRLTKYAPCNLCIDGTDPYPWSDRNCTIGEYICNCEGDCDSTRVGMQNITETVGTFAHCHPDGPVQFCWNSGVARKVGGAWYSHLADGHCKSDSKFGSCSWRVLAAPSVPDTCVKENLMGAVEDAGPECFKDCGARNTSSDCWIGCFYDTMLGPEARKSDNISGMPVTDLQHAWTKSFLDESEGGCPKIGAPGTLIL